MARHYKDLIVWQNSMKLVIRVYAITDAFPRRELFGLTNQLRRAAVSVPSNIAEGQARFSHREFVRFLRNARGSLAEVETQTLIAHDLHYITAKDADQLSSDINEISRILMALTSAIQAKIGTEAES
jgi:four helix bundle protein